jgi:ABC-2 type transport system permease protein
LFLPVAVCYFFQLPFILEKVLLSIVLVLLYLVFTFLISFIISTLAFHITRVHSFTLTKHLALLLFTGELIPLDLLKEPYKTFFMNTPFTSAVYLPVGYITGRIDFATFANGFFLVSVGILTLIPIAILCWHKGKAVYVGTGA